MSAPTVAVTCTASDQGGSPVAGARFRAKLDQTEIYGGFVVPESVEAVADSNGVAVLNLWPNALGVAGSLYTVTGTNPDNGKKFLTATISVPNSACNLHQILVQAPYPAVDASAQALIAAQGALAPVTAQAGIATGAASTALGYRDTTKTYRDTVVGYGANINAVAADLTRIDSVAASLASVAAVSGALAAVNGVATNIASVNTVSSAVANVNTVAVAAPNVATVAGSVANVNTVGTAITSVNTVAGAAASVATVAGIAGSVTAAATNAVNISTVAGINTSVTAVSNIATNVTTVAGVSASVTAVAGNAVNVTAVAGNTANITAVAGNNANITAVAGNAANINAANGFAATTTAKAAEAANSAAQALAIYGNTAAQQTANTTAASQSVLAVSSAAQANVAKEQALQAWAASTYPMESLAAISKTIHSGAVVKSIIYDTGKDSDGGAWRKRCQDKSWFTEALGFTGTWRNQLATTAAAWAISGAAAGDGFQNTTDGKYYVLTGTTTAVEIFRGNVREFPEQVAVIAETGRVVIYDLTQNNCPMWMVFVTTIGFLNSRVLTSLTAINGELYLGRSSQGFGNVRYLTDECWSHASTGEQSFSQKYGLNIAGRNTNSIYINSSPDKRIINGNVNDIAVTVLDNAPIDPATGLPVPTIAVATAGGVSVIKDDGTVVTIGTLNFQLRVTLVQKVMFVSGVYGTNVGIWKCPDITVAAPVITDYYATYGMPQYALTDDNVGSTHIRTPKGLATARSSQLALLLENPSAPTKGLHAHITNQYTTGFQVGDSRLATLADTTAETITATNIPNGTFNSDISGVTGTGISWDASGALRIENVSGTQGVANITYGGVAGKRYIVYITYVNASTGSRAEAGAGNEFYRPQGAISANTTITYELTNIYGASSQLTIVNNVANQVMLIDNISIKLAEPDRSVKNNGLVINGTLVKSPVASGANLVAYSGFSGSNYLEQPYSSNLDFGTGDFSLMGWVNQTSTSLSVPFMRAATSVLSSLLVIELGSGINVYCGSGAYAVIAGTAKLNTWSLITVTRVSGILYLYQDGVQLAAVANTNNLTNTSARLNLGAYSYNGTPAYALLGSMSLWRISATAPSADQISHIYRSELPLFQPGAQCTIDGTSTAVTALAYDDTTDVLHVGTSWGRSEFQGLKRIASSATVSGAITTIAANQGSHITGGSVSGRYYQPALLLRDELRRKEEARKALGKVPVFFESDAIAAQVAFSLPKGYTTKAVYCAGLLKRQGATKAYTVSTDGFVETVTFAVAPGAAVEVSIMAVRSN